MSIIYAVMSYGGLALAVICLVVAIIFFVRWNIPKIVGDVTGNNQKKTIEKIRREGYEAGRTKDFYGESEIGSGTIHVRKTNTDELMNPHADEDTMQMTVTAQSISEAQVRDGNDAAVTEEAETAVLTGGGKGEEAETAVLTGGGKGEEAETAVLTGGGKGEEAETAVLIGEGDRNDYRGIEAGTKGVIDIPKETYTPQGTVQQVLELIITHTSEVVE